MTEQWKPVQHKAGCRFGIEAVGESCWRDCNGTRWSGYGERVGDCAAVYALCAWFGAMRSYRMFNMQKGPKIPWPVACGIYALYAKLYGREQSIERLNERGGFSWSEVEYIWKEHNRYHGSANSASAYEQAMLAAQQPKKEGEL